MNKSLSILLLAGILLILVYAPIALSGYTLASRTLIQLIVLALVTAWILWAWAQRKFPLPGDLLSWVLLLIAGYLIVSTLFSVYPHRSVTELRSILSYAGIFVLTIAALRTLGQIRAILWTVAIIGGGLSLFGFWLVFSGSHTIFGLIPVHSVDQLASTFPNYNHFAAYLGILIPATLGLWWIETSSKRTVLLLLTGIMTAGLFFTLSRGGIGSFLIGMILFALLMPKTGRFKNRWWGMVSVLVIAVVALVLFVHEPLSLRWIESGKVIPVSRIGLWQTALHAFMARPVFGFGLGTFRIIFPAYNQLPTAGYYRHALNDYLEALSELGIVGIVLVAAFLAVLLFSLAKIAHRSAMQEMRIIAIASITSLLILSINAMVNFPFHIPAISVTLAVLAAIPVAISSKSQFIRYVGLGHSSVLRWSIVGGVIIAILLLTSETIRPFVSDQLMNKSQSLLKQHNSQEALKIAHRALAWDPKNARYHYIIGDYYRSLARKQDDVEMQQTAIRYFKKATRLSPWTASYYYYLGDEYIQIGDYQQAKAAFAKSIELDSHYLSPRLRLIEVTIHDGDTSLAITQYRRLLASNPNSTQQILAEACRSLEDFETITSIVDESDIDNRLLLADALIGSRRLGDAKTIAQDLLSRADEERVRKTYLNVLRFNQEDLEWMHASAEYLKRFPDDVFAQNQLIHALANSDIEFPTVDNYIRLAFPDTASWQYKMIIAKRRLKMRDYEQSGEIFFNILETVPDNSDALMGLGQSYEYSGQYLEAILIYHKILELNPDNDNARFRLAMSYRRQGMLSQGVEQLRECLRRDPHNERARRQLSEIRKALNLASDSANLGTP